MKKIYQPFIIEKAGLILDVLKDDVSITDFTMDRMCDLLTDKFISGDLSSDDPIQEIFNEKELLLYINEMEIHKDLDHLIELELIDYFVDDNEGLLNLWNFLSLLCINFSLILFYYVFKFSDVSLRSNEI